MCQLGADAAGFMSDDVHRNRSKRMVTRTCESSVSLMRRPSFQLPMCLRYQVLGGCTTTPSISIWVVKQPRDDSAWAISFDVVCTTWNTILADIML